MSLSGAVAALAGRVATEFNTVRGQLTSGLSTKADDSAVVKLTGAQSVAGLKTFVNGVATSTPSAANMAVRHDDTRLAAVAGKADDSTVVHSTGAETVAGIKTFSAAPVVAAGTAAGNPLRYDDASRTNARTPTAHVSTHATGGGDALAPADIGAVPTSRSVSPGTGLTGGGTLAADRTLTVAYGTTSGTAAQGNDSRITGAEQTSNKGATNGYAPLSSGLVPTANLPNVISTVSTLTYSGSVTPNSATSNNFYLPATGSFTLNPPSNPTNGQMLMVEVKSTASVTATIAAGIALQGSLASTLAIPSGKTGFIGLRYSGPATTWFLLATSVQP